MKTSTLTKKQKYRIVAIIFIICLAGIFLTMTYTLVDDWPQSSKVPLVEHYNLFTKEAQSKLQLLATTTNRNRETTSSLVYNKKFNLFVLKVILTGDQSLKNVIKYNNESSHVSLNAFYAGLPGTNMDMKLKSGKSVLVSSVKFKHSGDLIKLIQESDNFYCYYYKFKTFSVNYNDEAYDIVAKADNAELPASLAFIKKGKFLYIAVMTVANGKEEMDSKLLYDIIDTRYKNQA